ncbi:hypothetical protein B0T16DRAFT_461162 [Cercophora newfieldiana]|uniref:Pheromone-regulated membrane protein n=1 Tax=Cercophora newfieldiana TaxID=92897 RepID=A0AA39XWT4_9PEZI|nr:hypothetical protein B0T16DRAFT_461162 [Cercophora newfieldiana]
MGLFSHKRSHVEVQPEQKWDFISLGDFKSTNCFTPFAYGYLWFSLLLSVTVYAVDTFTAYQLLAFNAWSSQVEPTQLIPFDVSKWIFSVCIILSFLNLGFEHFRAQKIMRRGSVAESFLDNLAVRLESIRMGKGRGWKRFLVFAELTKSKKGSEIVALFTYFSFQAWVRIIICSGPRQVVNALTLYSVASVKLTVEGDNFESSFSNFFEKIRALAMEDVRQALILSGMLYTLVIWLFAFLSLLIAALFFVFYLWHIIPRDDGGLTGFCERKINKRLKQIVSVKINKAMADDERKKRKAEIKAAMKNGQDRPMTMQPSLPTIPNLGYGSEDSLPAMPSLSRADTLVTLDEKAQPNTPGSFEMGAMGRPGPKRTATMATTTTTASYSSKAPLLNSAAEIGISRPESPAPSLTPTAYSANIPPSRTGTMSSNRSYGQGPGPNRMASNVSSLQGGYGAGPGLNRMASNGSSLQREYTASPAPFSAEPMPAFPPPARSPTAPAGYSGPNANQANGFGQGRPPYGDYPSGRASPAPSNQSYGSNPLSPRGPDGYPMRSATNPVPPRGPPQRFAPQRNMTAPIQPMYGHQQTPSNSSLRNMVPSPARPYHESQGSIDYNRPPTANSQRNGPRGQPYQQGPEDGEYDEYFNRPPTANSQRNGPRAAQPYSQAQESGEYDYFDRPPTSNSQRGPPRGGYGNGGGNGWNQDVERGNGSRY